MQFITDEEITKNSGVALDVAASGASPKVSIPLGNIVKEEALQQLVNSKTHLKHKFQHSFLFESNVQLPSQGNVIL